MKEYLKAVWTESEKQDIRDLATSNPTFYENVLLKKIDYTGIIKKELINILYGPIPRNFIINIKNCIGSPTGVFKSSFGLQLAMELDPTFTVEERVAFTPNQLNELIKQNAKRKQIFVLDERIHDLKQSADMRLANIAESCRERQICLILIGVTERFLNVSHYHFERFGESDDSFLPEKTVYFLVKKIMETRKIYRGYFVHNILPLSDTNWNVIWDDYMKLKDKHQNDVIDQKVSAFDFEAKAYSIANSEQFKKECLDEDGDIIKQKVKNFVYKEMPDITNEERKMVITELTYSLDKYLKNDEKDEKSDDVIENLDEDKMDEKF